MKKEAKELFLKNYQNKEDCKDLPKFIKSFEKEFKKKGTSKTIKYYPWAVIERIFRMQGGMIEVVDWASTVTFKTNDYAPDENGELVLTEQETHALFIHLKATWQGETLEEHYPLFDNQSAKIIKTPNALDLNTARQRGSVRLIARLSGIGLDIFEQQDTQFEDTNEEVNVSKKESTKKEDTKEEEQKPKPKKKSTTQKKKEKDKEKAKDALGEIVEVEDKPTKKEEPKEEVDVKKADSKEKETEDQGFLKGFLDGEEVEEKTEEIKQEQKGFVQEEFDKESQEYADLLLEVRKTVRKGNLQKDAKSFIKGKSKELLSDLSYSELKELLDSLEKV